MVQNKGPIEKLVSGYFSKELHVTVPRSSYFATSQNVNQMWKMNLSWRHRVQTWHPTAENFANDTFSRQISPLTA